MEPNILPPGFRFYPTEEELLGFYLHNKLESIREEEMQVVIPVVDVYDFDPWHLPGEICRHDGQEEYFFFCPRQEREAHGGRPTRTTPSGYWKATGSPCRVFSSNNRVLGVKKTMVFYRGKAPNGHKTKWKMNEYRCFEDDDHATTSTAILTHENARLRGEYSVCRVYTKSGCIRSFDRRPGLEATTSEPQRAPSPAGPPPPIIDTNPAPVSRRRSHESNSSDGDDGLSSSARFVRQRTEDTDDWDLLEWFS